MRARRWLGALNKDTPSQVNRRAPGKPPKAYREGGFDSLRQRLNDWVQSKRVQWFITVVICLNALTLGLETSSIVMRHIGGVVEVADTIILTIFVIELSVKIFAQGTRFVRDGWNIFDFLVVAISFVPSAGPLSALRALRVLRVLRLVSIVPAMRKVVQALLASIPGVSSIIALLLLVFYVFAVIATQFYGAAFPNWFGTVGESMYSLFQIMTLESWSMGIVRPVMEKFPGAWAVFVPFILLTSFAVLNLFIAVIVNAMQEQHLAEAEEQRSEIMEAAEKETEILTAEIRSLRDEVRELRDLMKSQRS